MPPTKTEEKPLLEKLYDQRQARVDEWSSRVNEFETERATFEERAASEDAKAQPTDDERSAFIAAKEAFKADNDLREAELKEFDERIVQQTEMVRRRQEAAKAHVPTITEGDVREPLTYRRDTQRVYSYWRDLAVSQVDSVNFSDVNRQQANERLTRHASEMEVEIPMRVEAAEQRSLKRIAEAEAEGEFRRGRNPNEEVRELLYQPFHRGAQYNPYEKRVEPNRTDGYGGFQEMAAA